MSYPVDEPFVTCKYDQKGKAWRAGRHTGIDFRAPRGTEIKAIDAGKVIYAGRGGGWGGAYGLQVIVQHGSHRVIYAHLSSINIKGLRDKIVAEGDLIRLEGCADGDFGLRDGQGHYSQRRETQIL